MRHKQSTSTRGQGSGVRGQLRRGFTLTELLIVIAIIAVLASLIAAAALNAWNKAKRNRIVMEIQSVGASLEDFRTKRNAYPPNGMNPNPVNNPPSGSAAALVLSDFRNMFQRAFPRNKEPQTLIAALVGQNLSGGANENLPGGLRASEALYFWLGGFSADEEYPISGPGGPSFVYRPTEEPEILENRVPNSSHEFDLTRLGPRNNQGGFLDTTADPSGGGRFLLYPDPTSPNTVRRINFWRYTPKGSTQPLVYFDVSRYKPYQYDLWAADTRSPVNAPPIFALKQLRSGGTFPTNANAAQADSYQNNVVFVDQGKFQILHSGLDDAWGDDFARMSLSNAPYGWGTAQLGGAPQLLLYPTGPFLGDIADNLTSVADGTLGEQSE
jgi:prepilin-type N-terminal cleavage/methylation domain-containing protein